MVDLTLNSELAFLPVCMVTLVASTGTGGKKSHYTASPYSEGSEWLLKSCSKH